MTTAPATSLTLLCAEKRYDEIEEKWMAAVEQGYRDLEDYRRAALGLIDGGRGGTASALLGVLVDAMANEDVDDERVRFAETAVRLGIIDSTVRSAASRIHAKAGETRLPALLKIVEEKDSEANRERVLKCIDFAPGSFVDGSERVGPERVVSFDESEGFTLDDGESPRVLSVEAAASELTALSDDNFRALLRFDVDRLKQMSKDDPDGLVRCALAASNGRLEWPKLKKLMARGVVAPNQFSRWWNKAKGLVERDPMVQVYGDKEPILILRDDPISHEEEMQSRIERAESALEQVALVLEYLASVDQGHEADRAFLTNCAELLVTIANDATADGPVSLLAAAVHADVAERLGDDAPGGIDVAALVARDDLGTAPQVLSDEDQVRRSLVWLKENGEEAWPAVYAQVLPTAPGRLPDLLARELLTAGKTDLVVEVVQSILATPHRFGEGVFWLWKASSAGALEELSFLDAGKVTLAMLRLMDSWARSAKSQVTKEQKALLTRMKSALSASNFKTAKTVCEEANSALAVQLHGAVKDNQGITEVIRHQMTSALMKVHSDAIMGTRELWEEDDVIYVSPRGLKRREKEFEQIVNEDMVKNSAAIGQAADFGDLSENAEFTAALEQRDFLSRRANEIGEELKKAAVVPIDMIDVKSVNVGTAVRVKDVDTGEALTYTFLGPWDVDLDNNVYSYKAPFSLAFLGHVVGDRIVAKGEHGDRTLEITAIELAELPE
ncbi:MAG: GreA/GreB family elongation factor [Planctomycetota bacterium JB042]